MNYKRIFANGYSYFITIVTQQREPLLVDNIGLLRIAFGLSKRRYDYSIDAIVVLPDHIHMIITPKNAKEYPKIISHIKRSFVYGLDNKTKDKAKMRISSAKYRRKHSGVWQERYYEHTIRDEEDWLVRLEYIRINPVKHNLVEDATQWEYSSFYKK